MALTLYPEKAARFWKRQVEFYNELLPVYQSLKMGLPTIDSEHFVCTVAILLNDFGRKTDATRKGRGCDLLCQEVKSAGIGSSFEYQYFKISGREKLKGDQAVAHVFCCYSKAYEELFIHRIPTGGLAHIIASWEPEFEFFLTEKKKDARFRKHITHEMMLELGETLLHIKDNTIISCAHEIDDIIHVIPPATVREKNKSARELLADCGSCFD